MPVMLTQEQVLALAPDASSVSAAKGLTADSKWQTLGADEEALWGECKGSGAKPYQSQVDLIELTSKCSCPSRKFPCKHCLALMLLYSKGSARFSEGRPPWVEEWLASGRARKAKKAEAASKPAADPQAQAAAAEKREANRWKRIAGGCADLQSWIADLLRHGLASVSVEQRREWSAMAARMVDAQAPGLTQRLQDALQYYEQGSAHYEEVVEALGLVQLATAAVERRHALSAERLADLRAVLGWVSDKEEWMAASEAVDDKWLVLGQYSQMVDTKLTERRVWLFGQRTRRYALLQEYAYQGRSWEFAWLNGRHYAARLYYYPGSAPLRAFASEPSLSDAAAVWPECRMDEAIDVASGFFAANPWLQCVPLWFEAATPLLLEARWMLHSVAGVFPLQVSVNDAWDLLAFSGGHSLRLFGEWDGRRLRPLSASFSDGDGWHMAEVPT